MFLLFVDFFTKIYVDDRYIYKSIHSDISCRVLLCLDIIRRDPYIDFFLISRFFCVSVFRYISNLIKSIFLYTESVFIFLVTNIPLIFFLCADVKWKDSRWRFSSISEY